MPLAAAHVLGLSFISLSIAIAGPDARWGAFAFPGFVALALLFFRSVPPYKDANLFTAFCMLLIIAAPWTFTPQPEHVRSQLAWLRDKPLQEYGKTIDTILDACGEDRYVFDGGFPLSAYARHLPIGPIFIPYFFNYLGVDHPLYTETFDRIRKNGKVLVRFEYAYKVNFKDFPSDVFSDFTSIPPDCAKNIPVSSDFSVLFRKGWNPT